METFSALLALCRGNRWSSVDSTHTGQWHRALMFSLICTRTNASANNRDAGDLRRHHAHYDVTVLEMYLKITFSKITSTSPWGQWVNDECMEWVVEADFLHEPARCASESVLKINMMTSSNKIIFRVTGPLCGEFTGHWWIPLTKASDAEVYCFLWSAPE